jgi:hypothetical protein
MQVVLSQRGTLPPCRYYGCEHAAPLARAAVERQRGIRCRSAENPPPIRWRASAGPLGLHRIVGSAMRDGV